MLPSGPAEHPPTHTCTLLLERRQLKRGLSVLTFPFTGTRSAFGEVGSSREGFLPTQCPAVEVGTAWPGHPANGVPWLHSSEIHIPCPKPVAEELAQGPLPLGCPSWEGMISQLLLLGTSCRR